MAATKAPGSPKSKKPDRCFFPDVPLTKTASDVVHHIHDTAETLFFRIVTSPQTAWYEAEDAKHVVVDSKVALDNSIRTLKKLLGRDLLKMDDLGFIKKPTAVANARLLLLESYCWSAMCLLGYTLALYSGAGDLLKWLIGPIFHPLNSLVMALLVPVYVHTRLRKAHWPEDEQRSTCFYGAVAFGAFAGYALGKPVPFATLIPLVPLWMGHVSGYLEFKDMKRLEYLTYSLVVPYVPYLVFGFLLFKGFLPFALAWTAFFGIIAVDMQLKLGRLKRRWSGKELEQWDSTAVMIVAHFFLSHLLTIISGGHK